MRAMYDAQMAISAGEEVLHSLENTDEAAQKRANQFQEISSVCVCVMNVRKFYGGNSESEGLTLRVNIYVCVCAMSIRKFYGRNSESEDLN
jgi:hypothetical protein